MRILTLTPLWVFNTASPKGLGNGIPVDAKSFNDVRHSPAAIDNSSRLFYVPLNWAWQTTMGTGWHNCKILYSVIETIPIFMMHVFCGEQCSTKVYRHNKSMLHHLSFCSDGNSSVSRSCYGAGSLRFGRTLNRAELSRPINAGVFVWDRLMATLALFCFHGINIERQRENSKCLLSKAS